MSLYSGEPPRSMESYLREWSPLQPLDVHDLLEQINHGERSFPWQELNDTRPMEAGDTGKPCLDYRFSAYGGLVK